MGVSSAQRLGSGLKPDTPAAGLCSSRVSSAQRLGSGLKLHTAGAVNDRLKRLLSPTAGEWIETPSPMRLSHTQLASPQPNGWGVD